MEEYEWLNSVRIGDNVISRGRTIATTDILTVTGVTATQIITGESKWRKKNGNKVGVDIWFYNHLEKTTPEKIAQIDKEKEEYRMNYILTKWISNSSFSFEELRAMKNVVDTMRKG